MYDRNTTLQQIRDDVKCIYSSQEHISEIAYFIWETDGRKDGSQIANWLEAKDYLSFYFEIDCLCIWWALQGYKISNTGEHNVG